MGIHTSKDYWNPKNYVSKDTSSGKKGYGNSPEGSLQDLQNKINRSKK